MYVIPYPWPQENTYSCANLAIDHKVMYWCDYRFKTRIDFSRGQFVNSYIFLTYAVSVNERVQFYYYCYCRSRAPDNMQINDSSTRYWLFAS